MDKLKPEDDLIPDPSDRQSGRSRNIDTDNEPQLNVDDIEIDMDDRRVSKAKRTREDDENYELDEDMAMETRPSRGRKKAARQKAPLSRQYLMMGTGILVLLLLIFGIGSALKGPSPSSDTAAQSPGAEKSIDLSGAHDSSNTPVEPAAAASSQDISIPPISSTPTQAQNVPQPEGQQRVELQGDLGTSLTQQQNQIETAVTRSTLPMEPATVASIAGSKATESRPERKTTVIEPVQKAPTRSQTAANTESKPAPVKRTEPTHVAAAPSKPAAAPSKPVAEKPAAVKPAPVVQAPAVKAPAAQAPVAQAQTKPAAPAAAGHTQALKSASGSSYTLQLNASSNSANLNAWAKKENLQNFIVYQTSRNGQPWYVMVSGIYANKADAERAISSLPAGVQSNKPWTKPIHQVQSEIK